MQAKIDYIYKLYILVNLNLMDEMVGQQTPKKNKQTISTLFFDCGEAFYIPKNTYKATTAEKKTSTNTEDHQKSTKFHVYIIYRNIPSSHFIHKCRESSNLPNNPPRTSLCSFRLAVLGHGLRRWWRPLRCRQGTCQEW